MLEKQMDWTAREVVDFAVSVLDDMDAPAFPAEPVLTMLAPSLDARMKSFGRVATRSREIESVAPWCRQESVAQVLDVYRSPTVLDPALDAVRRRNALAPMTGPELFGGAEGWKRCPVRGLIMDIGRCDQMVLLPLTFTGDNVSALIFSRRGRDFSRNDLSVLSTVQPLLSALVRHTGHLALWRAHLGGHPEEVRAAVTEARLSPREVTVLHLVAQGLTAVSIARRLGCSPRTVEKHTANLYRKLEVRDRVSAVLEGQRRRLLGPT